MTDETSSNQTPPQTRVALRNGRNTSEYQAIYLVVALVALNAFLKAWKGQDFISWEQILAVAGMVGWYGQQRTDLKKTLGQSNGGS